MSETQVYHGLASIQHNNEEAMKGNKERFDTLINIIATQGDDRLLDSAHSEAVAAIEHDLCNAGFQIRKGILLDMRDKNGSHDYERHFDY